jgi:WD40 repeat protein
VASGEELRRFDGHTNWVQMLEFSPEGDFVVSGAQDNTARRWRIDLTPGDLLRFVEGQRYRRPLDCGERAQFRLPLPPACQS